MSAKTVRFHVHVRPAPRPKNEICIRAAWDKLNFVAFSLILCARKEEVSVDGLTAAACDRPRWWITATTVYSFLIAQDREQNTTNRGHIFE